MELPGDLPWERQVEHTAKASLAAFESLQSRFDFETVARESFPSLVAEVVDPHEVIFFTWFVADETEAKRLARGTQQS